MNNIPPLQQKLNDQVQSLVGRLTLESMSAVLRIEQLMAENDALKKRIADLEPVQPDPGAPENT